MPDAVTIKTLRRMMKAGEAFACLTCYDATSARWLERAGVHVLLVGDTAAEIVLGFERTIDMPLDVLIALTAGVRRGAPSRMVMADMPFMSYQTDEATAMRNAGRFMTEGRADVVKMELDGTYAALVEKLTRAGVPVCAHVGSRPQLAALSGGYSAAGRTPAEAQRIIDDARALEAAGAVMLLVEAVPDGVAKAIVEQAGVPVIGIGAGESCHGQVLVLHDLLGLTDSPPVFAEPLAKLGSAVQAAAGEWVRRVAARTATNRPPSPTPPAPDVRTPAPPRPADRR